jgi:hypothetical protein
MSSKEDFQNSIILSSLQLIKTDSKVKKFYFLPGFLSIIFLSVLLVYQAVYTYVVILWKKEQALEVLLEFFHSTYASETLIISIVFILIYTVIMPIFEGGLIRYIDRVEHRETPSSSDALGFWIFRFYAVFEFNNIFGMFKLVSILNGYLFVLRFLWVEYIASLSILFMIALLFSIIIGIFTAYAKYEIVLENKTVFPAIAVSSQIALLNPKTTLKLYFMMFILNIRVILNFFLFLMFPLLFITLIGFITSQIFITIAALVLGIVFVFFVIFLWYMSAVLEILTTAIWYHAYIEGRKKLVSHGTETH